MQYVVEVVYRYVFLVIQGDTLVTRTVNMTVFGAPSLVPAPQGGFAILLNGIDQYFQLPTTESCLLNPTTCNFGLYVKFKLKILEFQRPQTYILSCGADDRDFTGVAMWWRNDRLVVRVRTQDKIWKVRGKYLSGESQFQDFVSVEFTWNVDSGLSMFIDGEFADMNTVVRKAKFDKTPDECLVGKRRGQEDYFNIAIADLYIVYAPRNMIAELGVDTGQ